MPYTLTDDEIQELWLRYGAGESPASLARRFDKPSTSIAPAFVLRVGSGRTTTGVAEPPHRRGTRGDLARAGCRPVASGDRPTVGPGAVHDQP